jgi:hypothetical protein
MNPVVQSFVNVHKYGWGANRGFVDACQRGGFGSLQECTAAAQQAGVVACVDFGVRSVAGLGGAMLAVKGVNILASIPKKDPWKEKTIKILHGTVNVACSIAFLAMAFFFPVMTVDGHGRITL